MAYGNPNPVYAVAIVAILILVGIGVLGGLNLMDDRAEIELPEIEAD
jgi:hypothetical protein